MNSQAVPSNPPPFAPLTLSLSDEQRLELVEYWRSIVKRKWSILFLALAMATVAGAIVYSLPPVYRATTTVLIEAQNSRVVKIDEVYGGITQDREHYQTQVEILKSRDVALRAVRGLKLWEQAEFDPRKAEAGWRDKLKALAGLTEPEPEWNDETMAEAALGKVMDQLSVEPVRLSQLVKVNFESQDPRLAALVAQTIAQVYINTDREAKFKLTQEASAWLQDRLEGLRVKLDSSERALQNYRDKQGLVNLAGSAQQIDSQQITSLTQRLVDARVRRAENESVYQDLARLREAGVPDYTAVAAVMRHPSVVDAKRLEAAAQQKLSELSQRYGFEHPRIVQATAEVTSAKANAQTQMDSVAASLVRDYEISRATERQLELALGGARGSIQSVNRKEAELGVLEREVQGNKQLYELFMGRAKETSASSDLQSQVARVVDAAAVPNLPVRPKKGQIIAVALVLGLFGGALLALLLDKLDNTLKGQEDTETRLKLTTLTSLPMLKGSDRKQVMRLMSDKPDSMFAEAIRTARTGVMLSSIDTPHKVIMVTSSVPGEGKTVFSANMALAHAATRPTLLIDADLRRPSLARGLSLPKAAKGLSNLVAGTASLEECVHHLEGSSLHVIPAGDVPPNPTEILLSQRFKDTLKELSEKYDVVVIDTPPVELVSDALVVAPQATAVIYVVKAMDTPYPLARKGLVRLNRAGANVLGVVLNQVDFKKAQKYYGQYSAYGHYGYGDYGYKPVKA